MCFRGHYSEIPMRNSAFSFPRCWIFSSRTATCLQKERPGLLPRQEPECSVFWPPAKRGAGDRKAIWKWHSRMEIREEEKESNKGSHEFWMRNFCIGKHGPKTKFGALKAFYGRGSSYLNLGVKRPLQQSRVSWITVAGKCMTMTFNPLIFNHLVWRGSRYMLPGGNICGGMPRRRHVRASRNGWFLESQGFDQTKRTCAMMGSRPSMDAGIFFRFEKNTVEKFHAGSIDLVFLECKHIWETLVSDCDTWIFVLL